MIHFLTAIGLSPGGSTHLHTIHRTAQITTNTQITTNVEVVICVLVEAFACNVEYMFIAFVSIKCPLFSASPVGIIFCFFVFWRISPPPLPQWAMASSFTRFLDHTQRRTTVGRTPLDERPLPDNTQHSQQTNIHARGGIRTRSVSRRAAADLRLRPRRHWDPLLV